jgi:hypothetical protein
MKSKSHVSMSLQLPESNLVVYSAPRKHRSSSVKLIPPPVQPDEKTIRRLNKLAQQHPFCLHYKVKKYDLL